MAIYSISNIEVKDWAIYEEYMKKVPKIIEKYGGKYLVRGGQILSDDTKWQPKRIVILEFPTKEDMDNFKKTMGNMVVMILPEGTSCKSSKYKNIK